MQATMTRKADSTISLNKTGVNRTKTYTSPVLHLIVTDECGKNAVALLGSCGKKSRVLTVEAFDLVYSETRDLVGVVRGVDDVEGTADIRIGHETLRFWAVRGQLVRPRWDGEKYAWEYLTVLRDE